jgi:hypothetical protein
MKGGGVANDDGRYNSISISILFCIKIIYMTITEA